MNFQGFKANVLELEQAGWDIALSQTRDLRYNYNLQLILKNTELDLCGITEIESIDMEKFLFGFGTNGSSMTLPQIWFRVRSIAPKIRTVTISMQTSVSFFQADFEPRLQTYEEIDLDTLMPFQPKSPKEIIVEPSEVNMWLDKLLEAQAPEQQRIRQRKLIANLSTF